MNVLFVYSDSNALAPPAKPLKDWIEISFAVSYLAAVLKLDGHDVQLVVLRHGRFTSEIDKALAESNPDLVCFSAVATEFQFLKRVGAYIRTVRPSAYQAMGGSHVSLRPDDAVGSTFDAICVGEGDEAIRELANALVAGERPSGIQNFWFQNGEALEKNPTRDFVSELDDLPFPDREIWRPWIERDPDHTILLGRGCPFPCTYCSNHALWKLADGNYVRFRSTASVMSELEDICERFPKTEYCYFEVETITADKECAFELADALEKFNAKREKPLGFAINLRVHRHARFRKLFAALSKANFEYVRVGVESGSERVRKEVLKRTESNQDLINTFDDARDAGIGVFSYNLIGMPGETPKDFLETVELNKRCKPAQAHLAIFYPYPGTELEKMCSDRGIVVPPLEDCAERYRAYLGLPEFPNRKIESFFRRWNTMVSGEQMPLFNRIDAYVWQSLRKYPALTRVAKRMTGTGILTKLRRLSRPVTSFLSARS